MQLVTQSGVRFLKILLLQASYAGTAHARTTTTTMVPSTYNFYYGQSVGSLGAYDLGRTQTRDVSYKAKHSPHLSGHAHSDLLELDVLWYQHADELLVVDPAVLVKVVLRHILLYLLLRLIMENLHQLLHRDRAVSVGVVLTERPPDVVLVVDHLHLRRGHQELVQVERAVLVEVHLLHEALNTSTSRQTELAQRGGQLGDADSLCRVRVDLVEHCAKALDVGGSEGTASTRRV